MVKLRDILMAVTKGSRSTVKQNNKTNEARAYKDNNERGVL